MEWKILPKLLVTRRSFFGWAATLGSSILQGTSRELPQLDQSRIRTGPDHQWPQFFIFREADELFLTLTAIGYRETYTNGKRYLVPLNIASDRRLVFSFPPQHYAETAVAVARMPDHIPEQVLSKIQLRPSRESYLVFRVNTRRRLRLTLEQLLHWGEFELLLPELSEAGSLYDLEIPRDELPRYTRVEMPWAIELSPLPSSSSALTSNPKRDSFEWKHTMETSGGEWSELWTTALESKNGDEPTIPFEVFSVRGFRRGATKGSTFDGNLVVDYSDDQSDLPPDWLGGAANAGDTSLNNLTSPLTNMDRIEIGAALSRRFPYSGVPGKSPINTGLLNYTSRFNYENHPIKNCYLPGRALNVEQFRLSARGGWLEFDSRWSAPPDCPLIGWAHSTIMGRDRHVKLEREGFLFPFGIQAQLIVLSDQAFIKDDSDHYAAVLIKQIFIEVPQPNAVDIPNQEGIFQSVSITTDRTPPLDLAPSGQDYSQYHFFVPTVGGQPFEFEHVGIDWAGESHPSKMPLIFVSNAARSPNGLIWEPGYTDWKPSTSTSQPSDLAHSIPSSGDGLRVVDKQWNTKPFRFAPYSDALVAIAPPLAHGDTSQRVAWVEWTRGPAPPLDGSGIAPRPFSARTRTFKVRLHGLSQFSGDIKYSLATYRDVRFIHTPILDPEPNSPQKLYTINLPKRDDPDSSPYVFLMQTRPLINEQGLVSPETDAITRQRIRSIYFGLAEGTEPIPDSLFESIDNEIQFGMNGSSAGTGGLVVPDTPASTLTRRYGPVGDASFSWPRWPGYPTVKPKLEANHRLDYAAYRLAFRTKLEADPFDKSHAASDLADISKSASGIMGLALKSEFLSSTYSRQSLNEQK